MHTNTLSGRWPLSPSAQCKSQYCGTFSSRSRRAAGTYLIPSSIENFLLRSGLLEYILICQDFLTTSSVFLVLPTCLTSTRIPVTFTGQYSHFSLHHHQFSFTTTRSQIPLKFSEFVVETTSFSVAIHLPPQSHVPLCLMMVTGLHWALTMVLWKLLILSLAPRFHDQVDCQSRQSGFCSSTEDISSSLKHTKATFIFGIILQCTDSGFLPELMVPRWSSHHFLMTVP